ncbi:hypothetical protein V5E97_22475 [Singulisphaera sp. Ch08]|uniref:Uncharacterized protein n=1 Tax=Singulisphaera sp. Ch08 TaxID=3120278 RepID=A0AAU7C784_9BACT
MATPAERLITYANDIVTGLTTPIQGALNSMPSMDRRVLAIRGYLRFPAMGRGSIVDNWAWTNTDMEDFKKSTEFTRMKEAVEDVKSTFASRNVGYSLGVDPDKVRSLETQVTLWNQNPTVQTLGLELRNLLRIARDFTGHAGRSKSCGVQEGSDSVKNDRLPLKRHAWALATRPGQGV